MYLDFWEENTTGEELYYYKRDRPKKELQKIIENYSDNIQSKALEITKLKWDKLLSV